MTTHNPTIDMKLKLTCRNHAPSDAITALIEKELKSLLPHLQLDEARVHLERRLEESPPFSVSFHLVTPGPDIVVRAADHTLRAALIKAVEAIRGKIDHRQQKRSHRRETAPAIELARRRPAGGQRRA